MERSGRQSPRVIRAQGRPTLKWFAICYLLSDGKKESSYNIHLNVYCVWVCI